MNAAHTLRRLGMGFAVTLAGLVVIPVALFDKAPGGDKPKADARRAAEMVDAIVNRNKPPKIVDWRGDFPSRAALFPEDHDWKEETRARTAISRLEADQTEEVWEEMVKRIDDRRYSETVTSVKTGDAYIEKVGRICSRLAYSRLVGVFWDHLPSSPIKDGERVSLRLGIGDVAKWRKQRAAKSLYELQIEVCEKAIEALAKVEDVPRAEKDQARKKIEVEIAKLKRTKQPASAQEERPPTFRYRGRYNAEVAKRVRDGIKSGRYGDLGITEK